MIRLVSIMPTSDFIHVDPFHLVSLFNTFTHLNSTVFLVLDAGIKALVEHYMSKSSGDINALRDVISSQDLCGVDEIIIKRPVSASNSNNSSSSCHNSPQDTRADVHKVSGKWGVDGLW